MRERMNPDASLVLHLDFRTAHHAKVMCDDIFGPAAFRGEIIWVPGNGARGSKGLSMTHQTLLVFSRTGRPSPALAEAMDTPSPTSIMRRVKPSNIG